MRSVIVIACLAALVAACGGDEETAAPAQEEPEAVETVEPGPAPLPKTPVEAALDQPYKVGPDGQPAEFEPGELPVEPGSVTARWYRSGGVYVVLYDGLALGETGPLCPGNSIQTAGGFEHVSNAPTEEGACEGAQNLAGADAGVRVCDSLVLYVTEIPADTEGTLFGTVERFEPDGTILGVTSQAQTDAGTAPEIEVC